MGLAEERILLKYMGQNLEGANTKLKNLAPIPNVTLWLLCDIKSILLHACTLILVSPPPPPGDRVVGRWELTVVRRDSDGSDSGLKVPVSWWWNQERRQHGGCALSSMLGPLPRQEQANVGTRLGVQGYAQTAHRSSRFCFRGFSTLLRDYTVRSHRFSRNLKHSNGFQASGRMQGAW